MTPLHVLRSALCVLALLTACTLAAQRRVTPVTPPEPGAQPKVEKTEEFDRSRLAHRHDAQGNVVLIDTVTGKEFVDSAAIELREKESKRMIYPLFHAVSVGVDLWAPIMRVCGQKHGVVGFWADVSLHNRYKPTVEIGLGKMDDTPASMNYTYRSGLAPYFKLGAKYNFLYNSDPAYQAYAQVLFGVTRFSWQVDDVATAPGYWDDPERWSIARQTDWATYAQVSFGLRAKIAGPVSVGWAVNYHIPVSLPSGEHGRPMYIPGWGKRNQRLNASISVIYTLPLRSKPRPAPEAVPEAGPEAEPAP